MKPFLRTLLIFILVPVSVMAVVEVLARMLQIPKISHHNIYSKSQDLIPQIDSNTVVILGDSRAEWGLRPLDIMKELEGHNLQVINMALPGSNGLDVVEHLVNNKVFPKAVVLGYTANYGRYKNHGLEKTKFTFENRLREKVKFLGVRSLYTMDESIPNYFLRGYPYFKKHEYDQFGGAVVYEYGDYTERLQEQLKMYQKWNKKFDVDRLQQYSNKMNKMIADLNAHGTLVLGVYMPVSQSIHVLEKPPIDHLPTIHFNKYYDFSSHVYTHETVNHDSIYFYDGSHLSHQYANVFSHALGKVVSETLSQ